MKIWKARLNLFYTLEDDYDIKFGFELQNEDYKINKDEWIYSEGWISTRIPMIMTVENANYGAYKVEQGFDHELNNEELKQLESDMKVMLKKKLDLEKEKFLLEYNRKIELL